MTKIKTGSLIIVGTGINVAGQTTVSAKANIEYADIVFTAVPGKAAMHWIKKLNANVVPFNNLYEEGKSRKQTYQQMTDAMVNAVREGKRVCAAFYGHPGVFVTPTHHAITQLRAEGYQAQMEPGISAEDCLVADLGIDPGKTGCQTFEASQFLFYKRNLDPHCLLVIWQIGLAGEHTLRTSMASNHNSGLKVLTNALLKYYPPKHEVIIYEASTLPIIGPRIERIPLSELPNGKPTEISTLVVPSLGLPEFDHDTLGEMGLKVEDVLAGLNPQELEQA